MALKAADAALVDQMVRRIVTAVDPDRIVLFGSRARGEGDSQSDFDILIIGPSAEPRWQRTIPVYRLLSGMGVPKDVVWWTPEEVEEWRAVQSHFINTVCREGEVVYERAV